MRLKTDFCEQYVEACGVSLSLPKNYCAVHSVTPDPLYSFPLELPKPATLDPAKALKPAFPKLEGTLPLLMSNLVMRPDANVWWLLDQTASCTT